MAKTTDEQAYVFGFITPKAGVDKVDGLQVAEDRTELKIKVRAIPDEGKANKAACTVLAGFLKVPKSAVSVVSGSQSRHKRFLVEGLTQDEVNSRLEMVK